MLGLSTDLLGGFPSLRGSLFHLQDLVYDYCLSAVQAVTDMARGPVNVRPGLSFISAVLTLKFHVWRHADIKYFVTQFLKCHFMAPPLMQIFPSDIFHHYPHHDYERRFKLGPAFRTRPLPGFQ